VNAIEPQTFGGKNVPHQLQRAGVRTLDAHLFQNFTVRPTIVGKLAPQIVRKIHAGFLLKSRTNQDKRIP
jgi:hypothetical protein